MNTRHTLIRIATLAFAATVASVAQAEAGDNRGETMFADKGMPTAASDLPRADIKAATREANRNGGLGNNGQATYRTYNYSQLSMLAKSTKTRSERKAETAQAIKNHQMVHAGEFI